MVPEVNITWEQVEEYINKVAETFSNDYVSGVYGIPRGGLVLAVMLSHKLNIPLLLAPVEDCIIIDDIADSGRTLVHFTNNDTQFNKYHITTMCYAERSSVVPDYWHIKKNECEWIRFPWEV